MNVVRRCEVTGPIDSGSGPSVPPNAQNPSQVSAWYDHQCNGDAFCIHRLEVEGCTQLMGYNDGTCGGSSDLAGHIADLINQPLPTVDGCDWLCLLKAVSGWDDYVSWFAHGSASGCAWAAVDTVGYVTVTGKTVTAARATRLASRRRA